MHTKIADDFRTADAVAVGLLAVLAVLARLVHLARSPWPVGTDGYYYIVQITDLVATGHLHVPDGSWVLPVLAVPHVLGVEPVLAVKLSAALLAGGAVPLAWAAGRSLGTDRSLPWLLAGWAAASPTLTFLAAEFPKNLGVVAPLLAVIALAPRRAWWARAGLVLAAVLALTAHRTGAGLLILGGVGALAGGLLRDRRAWLALGGAAVLGVGAMVLLPGMLHPSDLARLKGQLGWAGWPLPRGVLGLRPLHPVHAAELWGAWLGLPSAVVLWRRGQRRLAGGLGLPLLVLVAVPWRQDVLDLGFRLVLLAPLVAAPLIAGALAPWLEALRARTALGSEPTRLRWTALLLPLLAPLGYDHDQSPPYAAWARLVDRLPQPLPELVIAPMGLSFLVDHRTGGEAMAWAPDPWLDRTRVWRLAAGLQPEDVTDWGDPDLPAPEWLSPGWAWVREDAWEAIAASAPPGTLDPRNPTEPRPGWLTRGRGGPPGGTAGAGGSLAADPAGGPR